ncbi:MAG TPA: hypothetical protein VLZ53_07245 [Devosia sp.]|nr:hypothetical protein [Devosia sp.]
MALLVLVVLPGIVGEPADGGDSAQLHGLTGKLTQTALAQEHASSHSGGAGHGGALGVGVGLQGFDDLVDIEH